MILRKFSVIIFSLAMILVIGCADDGDNMDDIALPTDERVDLYCEDAGVYPETCILDDPDNPFEIASLNEDNKRDLSDTSPSAKTRFYLWATMTAKNPSGENQYFTAVALHELYTLGQSENAKKQAKKAYQAVLDHFYNSTTWYLAEWITEEEVAYAILIRDLVGKKVYDPSGDRLANGIILESLYESEIQAQSDLNEWGYIYDSSDEKIIKIE